MDDTVASGLRGRVKMVSPSGLLSMLIAVGIIFIGIREFLDPIAGAIGYGVPLLDPRDGDLLAVKAVRDVVSGIVVLRAAKARTAEALDQAPTEALKTITADNAVAWFRHCGYALQD